MLVKLSSISFHENPFNVSLAVTRKLTDGQDHNGEANTSLPSRQKKKKTYEVYKISICAFDFHLFRYGISL